MTLKIPIKGGEADLEPRVYGPILDALADGPRRVGDLLDLPEVRGKARTTAGELVGLLVGSDQAVVMDGSPDAAGAAAARHFNRVLATRSLGSEANRRMALASAAAGTGLYANVIELATYAALTSGSGEDAAGIARSIWEPIARRGEKLLQKGVAVETEAESLDILTRTVRQVLAEKAPMWRQTGVL
jgi:hypothetical protein